MADKAPAEKKPLDKRTALAVLDLVEGLLRIESNKFELLGREVYADGLEDASILVGELRRVVANWSVSDNFHPRLSWSRLGWQDVRCGNSVPFEDSRRPARPCLKPLGHEGDCEP